jgi:N utilization substance protein A
MVVNELRGEKIDIVPFSEDLADFVAKALSPAKVSQVLISDDGTQADVIVPDHQLSLAIGREGQNARLAARLTGVRIDIRSETQLAEGVPPRREEEEVEYAEGQWVTNSDTGEMEWHAADGTVISEAEWNAQQAEPAAEAEQPGAEDAEEPADENTEEPAEENAEEAAEAEAQAQEPAEAEGAEAQSEAAPAEAPAAEAAEASSGTDDADKS